MIERDIACRDFVEIVTEYIEAALDPDHTSRVEEHLVICEPCAAYLDQMRLTATAAAALCDEEPDPSSRAALMLAFADWRRS